MAGTNPYLGVYYAAVHVFIQNVCEDKSRRTIAKRDFPHNLLTIVFLNSVRITLREWGGCIEVIEVEETFFGVLKALFVSILSSLLQVFIIVFQIVHSF